MALPADKKAKAEKPAAGKDSTDGKPKTDVVKNLQILYPVFLSLSCVEVFFPPPVFKL